MPSRATIFVELVLFYSITPYKDNWFVSVPFQPGVAGCQPTQLMQKGERMKISILSVTIRLHGSVRFDSSKNFSRRFANLWQRVSRGILALTVTEAAAKSLGIKLQSLSVRSLDDFESAFARAKKDGAQALIATPNPLISTHQRQVLEFAATNRLPAIYPDSEFVEAGGLMSYAANYTDLFRRAADFVDKILKGTKPADPGRAADEV